MSVVLRCRRSFMPRPKALWTRIACFSRRIGIRDIQSEDLKLASGGVVAEAGTIIVDDYQDPKKVFGVATGSGF